MMKKVLIVFLVLAYMNCYLGCYNSSIVPLNVNDNAKEIENNEMALLFLMADSTRYYFEENSYTFKNDTIIGKAYKNNEAQKKWVKLARSETYQIYKEEKTFDILKSFGIVATVGIVWFVVLAAVSLSESSWF
jgi:hypothetical protein